MTEKRGFLSRMFGGEKQVSGEQASDCCSVRIEEVPTDASNTDGSESTNGSPVVSDPSNLGEAAAPRTLGN